MGCKECGKEETNLSIVQIIGSIKYTVELCSNCAEKIGFISPFDKDNLFPLDDILQYVKQSGDQKELYYSAPIDQKSSENRQANAKIKKKVRKLLRCPHCGMSIDDIAEVGKVGCGNCYLTFHDQLDAIMPKLHGANRHVGKDREFEDLDSQSQKMEKMRLERQLEKAVKSENYELAASIRDKLNALIQ
ncbi:MAG: hypothetical protein GF307_13745 [candidate division Zixibacteria bacterium]|nr:hypothetical protein [candidate division Zixibacteria bacterium]